MSEQRCAGGGCQDPATWYVEWVEGGILGCAELVCERCCAKLNRGELLGEDDGWVVEVGSARRVSGPEEIARALRERRVFHGMDPR